MIDLPDIQFLASEAGDLLLRQLSTEDLSPKNSLYLLTRLRRDFTPQNSRAALEMAQLRIKAVEKFGDAAGRLFFTREALEQASHPLVRRYRAEQVARLKADFQNISLIDACCGIGADTLAFAQLFPTVLGLDIDPLRVEIARHNASALDIKARFVATDVCNGLPDSDVVFFDPARRDEQGKRIYNVERYIPPLSIIQNWKSPLIVVKLSPGVELAQLEKYNGGVEFISVNSDLKEAILWIGAGWRGYRATLLTEDKIYHWEHKTVGALEPNSAPILRQPLGWLVEPDPSIMRAGLVREAAEEFGGYLLDETIAYFTTDARPQSPWVRSWEILDWMPFNLKKLRAYLRERNVGNVTVKKRGSALTPEELISQLKLKGAESRVLVLTRYREQPITIICGEYTI